MAEQEKDWHGHFKQDFDNLVSHANDKNFNSEFDRLPQGEQIAMAKKLESYKSSHPGALQDVSIIGSDTTAPVVWRTEKEPIDPDQVAQTIEGHAKGAVTHDAQAQLDLRKDGERLSHMDEATKQKVIDKLESDGSYWHPFNGVPHADEVKNEKGETTGIAFSTYGGVNSDTMSLDKSVAVQREKAAEAYETTIHDGRVLSGDPDGAQKVMDRDDAVSRGEKPPIIGAPKWFQLEDQ